MRIFNKIIVVILLICIACFCLVGIVNAFTGFISWADTAQRIFNPIDSTNPFIITLALLFVFIVCVFLLVLEFYRRRMGAASISSSKTGFAMITLDTIADQIKASVSRLEGLDSIKVKVVPRSGGIIINMLAKLSEDQDIPAKMQEVVKEAAEVASEKLGIKVIKNNLTITGLTATKPADAVEELSGKEEPEEVFDEAGEDEAEKPEDMENVENDGKE